MGSDVEKAVLVLNAGSSSHKCALFQGNEKLPLWRTHMEWKEGYSSAYLHLFEKGKQVLSEPVSIASAEEGLAKIFSHLPHVELQAIGHRVVHGGEKFTEISLVTEEVEGEIERCSYLAPLHNPANLAGIRMAKLAFPKVSQYAVFDTAFHATMPEEIATYPLPYHWREKGLRRYGFHGISYSYCTTRAQEFCPSPSHKMVICHLGAGASLCAVSEGHSIHTTMGMTPLEGLMMGTRSGSIDPGLLLHLLKVEEISPDALETMLNKESGLLGISGVTEDMRDLLEMAEKGEQRAILAIEMFTKRLSLYLGEMIAALGGLDTLIFTAGIGEHVPLIREKALEPFRFMGVEIDQRKNCERGGEERVISTERSSVTVAVLPTHEEWEIAQQINNHTCRSRPLEAPQQSNS
ncbi:MAG: Acetate kinase [Chlamydiae bacterium]|nr:Acetate kinase [Chlamydiota bacterium]